MADYSRQISTALTGILTSLNNIDLLIKTTDDTVNDTHQELINSIQNKIDTIMYKNTATGEGNNNKVQGNYVIDDNYVPKTKVNPDIIKNYVPFQDQEIDDRTSFSHLDQNVKQKQDGGRRKRNRSSKNKRKSSEEQPEKKMEKDEIPEPQKPQKKSFFSRFNPFKTKGGKRSRKHRTTKKGGRRHK